MGHSYIEFRQKMVLINDTAIDSLIRMTRLKYRIFASDFGPECPINLDEQFQKWLDACDIGIGLNFDETISSEEQLRYFLRFLDEVETTVKSFGEFVPRDYRVQIISPTCTGPVRVSVVLRDLKKLRSLLQGELANGVTPIPAELQ